jgi:hypothetical protein
MTARYLEISYSDGKERIPLHRRDDVRTILQEHAPCNHYVIHTKWWYSPVVWLSVQHTWLRPHAGEHRRGRAA